MGRKKKLPMNRKDVQRLILTKRDDEVPKDFVPLYQVFTNPEWVLPGFNKDEWGMGEQRLYELRMKAFTEVKEQMRKDSVQEFDMYWNGNLDAINALGLNPFYFEPGFQDLAGIIVAFQITRASKNVNNKGYKVKSVSFGIRIKLYDKYRDALARAQITGSLPKGFRLIERKKITNSRLRVKKLKVPVDSEGKEISQIEVAHDELYDNFLDWCRITGISRSDALCMAIRYLIDNNPVEGLKPITEYSVSRSEVSKVKVVNRNRPPAKLTQFVFTLRSDVMNDVDDFIKRFNDDPANQGKLKMNRSEFVVRALIAYLRIVPLKYVDPVAYEKYQEILREKELARLPDELKI